jgi:hypothetical protein
MSIARMGRGVFGIALLGAAVSLSAANPNEAASKPTGNTDQQVAAALENVSLAIKPPHKATEHDDPCPKGDDNRASDLCAQWKAADATKASADVAFWFAVVESLISALTLAAAVAAARYAFRAAIATEATAQIAHTQVMPDVATQCVFQVLTDGRCEIVLSMQNNAANHAKFLRPSDLSVSTSDGAFDKLRLSPNLNQTIAMATVPQGHGHSVTFSGDGFTFDIAAIKAGALADVVLSVACKVAYESALGQPRAEYPTFDGRPFENVGENILNGVNGLYAHLVRTN